MRPILLLPKGSRNAETFNLRGGRRVTTFFFVLVVVGIVFAMKDQRTLAELIEDILRGKEK